MPSRAHAHPCSGASNRQRRLARRQTARSAAPPAPRPPDRSAPRVRSDGDGKLRASADGYGFALPPRQPAPRPPAQHASARPDRPRRTARDACWTNAAPSTVLVRCRWTGAISDACSWAGLEPCVPSVDLTLHGETLAALPAPAAQYGAASPCGHASTESEGALTLAHFGLIGTFHLQVAASAEAERTDLIIPAFRDGAGSGSFSPPR